MTDRYTDKKGRVHRVVHSFREDRENRGQKITEELIRILLEPLSREKEGTDGNRPVRKEIR